jgi:two-component system chemotaxis sensor kinase CheA
VPLSLSSLRVLAVHAGGAAVLIPLDAIRGTVKIDRARVCNAPEGRTLVWGDRAVPLIALASLVGAEPAVERSEPRIAVVLRGAREELALGVDQVLDAREIIVQSLPPSARADALVAGVAFDLASVPRIVLAPSELDAAAIAIREPAAAPRRETPDLPVLVVDDSLTTRMLEQTILEAAGYVVDVAVSAEEALAKAAERRYGLFIVDVEMPGMNGFEFVERTRADTRFRNIPCILVTSRNAPEDRRRGADAGAAAYFAKSEFSQDALIRSIRGLLR